MASAFLVGGTMWCRTMDGWTTKAEAAGKFSPLRFLMLRVAAFVGLLTYILAAPVFQDRRSGG